MNLVERFFRDITEDVIRDGSVTRVDECPSRDRLLSGAQPQPQALCVEGEGGGDLGQNPTSAGGPEQEL